MRIIVCKFILLFAMKLYLIDTILKSSWHLMSKMISYVKNNSISNYNFEYFRLHTKPFLLMRKDCWIKISQLVFFFFLWHHKVLIYVYSFQTECLKIIVHKNVPINWSNLRESWYIDIKNWMIRCLCTWLITLTCSMSLLVWNITFRNYSFRVISDNV